MSCDGAGGRRLFFRGDDMLCIAICDDEIAQCCHIEGIVKKVLCRMEVSYTIRQFHSGKALLQAVEDFDIIFLDIMMSEPDGMQTARLMREKKNYQGNFVFISSSREYALDAFDVDAVSYLLKPADEKKVDRILQKLLMRSGSQPQEFMMINKERRKIKVFLNNICYFEVRGRIVDVHTPDGVITYYEQIGNLEKILQGKAFFRCHKSYIVHLKYVNSYTKQEVILDNGERIMIAKRRYEAFCKEFLAYMRKTGLQE